jgi:hypothetical protein
MVTFHLLDSSILHEPILRAGELGARKVAVGGLALWRAYPSYIFFHNIRDWTGVGLFPSSSAPASTELFPTDVGALFDP